MKVVLILLCTPQQESEKAYFPKCWTMPVKSHSSDLMLHFHTAGGHTRDWLLISSIGHSQKQGILHFPKCNSLVLPGKYMFFKLPQFVKEFNTRLNISRDLSDYTEFAVWKWFGVPLIINLRLDLSAYLAVLICLQAKFSIYFKPNKEKFVPTAGDMTAMVRINSNISEDIQ